MSLWLQQMLYFAMLNGLTRGQSVVTYGNPAEKMQYPAGMLKTVIELLNQQQHHMRQLVQAQTRVAEQVNGEFDRVDEAVIQLNRTVGRLHEKLDQQSRTLGQQHASLTNLNRTLESQTRAVEQKLTVQFDRVDEAVIQLNRTVGRLHEKLDQQSRTLGQQQASLTDLNQTLGQLHQKSDQQSQDVAQVKRTLVLSQYTNVQINLTLSQQTNAIRQVIDTCARHEQVNNCVNQSLVPRGYNKEPGEKIDQQNRLDGQLNEKLEQLSQLLVGHFNQTLSQLQENLQQVASVVLQACDKNCFSDCFEQGPGKCDSLCKTKLGLASDYTCKPCDVNCAGECATRGAAKCDSSCRSGYSVSANFTCIPCDVNCASGCATRGAAKCDSRCGSGYGISANSTCVRCNTPYCDGPCNSYGPGTCDGPCESAYILNHNSRTCDARCQRLMILPTATVGNITSPFYPQSYFNYMDCSWIITAPWQSARINITFSDLQVEACCDRVYIYNGSSASSPLVATLTSLPSRSYEFNQTGVLIRMTSDSSVVGRGFFAAYQWYPI